MKKISTAAALLTAGALLFGSLIVACSPNGTGYVDEVKKPADGGGESDDNGKPVDGSWDFTGTDTYSIGSSSYASLTDKELTNSTAKGVKVTLSGAVKWGNGSASDAESFCLWFDKGSAYTEGKEADYKKGVFTVTVDNKTPLSIIATGNGSTDPKRWVAVCDSNNKVLTNGTLTNLSSADGYKTLKVTLPKAGTYKIYTSGTRVKSLTISNQAFESKTTEITNDAETLGLVATSVRNEDATIAKGEVKDGKIVITSVKEGTTKVYAGTSESDYATITVTVSATGAITTNIIKYVAFTTSTNDATANNRETLGLVGTSANSSASEYVTAEISEGKIVIKSVKAPGDSAKNVTITVTKAAGETATIAVTENRDGSLTVGTITKYERPAPVKDTDYTVAALVLTATNPIEYSTDAGSTWTALAASASYTATQNGSVKVRFAANDSYAASKDASVQLTDGNGGSVYSAIAFNANDLTTGDITADTEISASFTIHATSSKKWAVDENSKTFDSIAYTKRLKSGGGRDKASNTALEFKKVSAGTYKIAALSGGENRTLTVSDGTTAITVLTPSTSGSVETFTLSSNTDSIYIETSNGINIYGIYAAN